MGRKRRQCDDRPAIQELSLAIIRWQSLSIIDAGPARGAPGGGIDFESSVQSVEDLPGSAEYGEARFVRDNGHLYVFESGDDRIEGVDGWTDVGPIRGEQGSPGADGADGADGVSVTDATVNGSGVLVLTLSNSSTITAGNVVGPKGDKGDPGDPGEDGSPGVRAPGFFGGNGSPPGDESPYIVGDYWFDEASGAVWKKNS